MSFYSPLKYLRVCPWENHARQEVIQLKSPISLKIGTIVGFGEKIMIVTKQLVKYLIPFKLRWPPAKRTRCLLNTMVFVLGKDHVEKVDLCKDYWNPRRKIAVARHFFEIISLESQQKCWHQHFSEKGRKGCFFADFLKRKQNTAWQIAPRKPFFVIPFAHHHFSWYRLLTTRNESLIE